MWDSDEIQSNLDSSSDWWNSPAGHSGDAYPCCHSPSALANFSSASCGGYKEKHLPLPSAVRFDKYHSLCIASALMKDWEI